LEGGDVPTPKIAIRLPRNIVQEMRMLAHRESLKQDRTVTWVELLTAAAEGFIRRYEEEGATATDQ
jgi:hypothetical protein